MGKWEKVRLGDVCVVERGTSPRPIEQYITDDTNGINWIKIGDASPDSMFITETKEKIKPEGVKKTRKVFPGDFLLSNSMRFGRPYILKIEGCIHDGWLVIRNENGAFDKRFLYYYLRLDSTYAEFQRLAEGGVINNLNCTAVRNLKIPLPPLQMQRQIADALDRVGTLIEKREAQICKLDLLVKLRFLEMFGDPVTNPKGWEARKLQDDITFLTSGSRSWSSYFSDSGEIFLTIKNVKDSRLWLENVQYVRPPNTREAKRKRVQKDDLLISITADLGRTAVVPQEIACKGAYINQHLSLVRLDCAKINPYYVSHYLESEAGKRQFAVKKQAGFQSALRFADINALHILVPPIARQMQFADFVQQIETQKALLQQSLETLQFKFKSLMQKCFREELFDNTAYAHDRSTPSALPHR